MGKVKSCPINGFQDCRLKECGFYTIIDGTNGDIEGCSIEMLPIIFNFVSKDIESINDILEEIRIKYTRK